MVHMLSEEALILAAVLVACGLLLLGVMELLWPPGGRGGRAPPALLRRHESSLRPEGSAQRVLSPEREPAPTPAALPVTVQPVSQISAQLAPSIPAQLTPPFPVQLSLIDEIPAPVTAAGVPAY